MQHSNTSSDKPTIKHQDIKIIILNSNLKEAAIDKALKEKIYNTSQKWAVFLKWLLLSMGIGLTVSSIIFFFAYNWDALHKFVKIGIIQGLVVAVTLCTLLLKINKTVQQIILTGAALLVGVLFAVFGQIYQTGANAYDFFLAWCIFISIWVFISNFSALWLLYLILINTTIYLYYEQVAQLWSFPLLCIILFAVNSIAIIGMITKAYIEKVEVQAIWLQYIFSLAAIFFATLGFIWSVMSDIYFELIIITLFTLISYTLGIIYALIKQRIFYLAIIPLSCIINICSIIIRYMRTEESILLVAFFIVASITGTIFTLLHFQKKWNYGK